MGVESPLARGVMISRAEFSNQARGRMAVTAAEFLPVPVCKLAAENRLPYVRNRLLH
jgi:hypothetical protein